jgi:hypothetical protein
METELKSLKIDRSARHERESGPVVKLIIIAVVVALAALGTVFAYNKLNAAVPVFLRRWRSNGAHRHRLHHRRAQN